MFGNNAAVLHENAVTHGLLSKTTVTVKSTLGINWRLFLKKEGINPELRSLVFYTNYGREAYNALDAHDVVASPATLKFYKALQFHNPLPGRVYTLQFQDESIVIGAFRGNALVAQSRLVAIIASAFYRLRKEWELEQDERGLVRMINALLSNEKLMVEIYTEVFKRFRLGHLGEYRLGVDDVTDEQHVADLLLRLRNVNWADLVPEDHLHLLATDGMHAGDDEQPNGLTLVVSTTKEGDGGAGSGETGGSQNGSGSAGSGAAGTGGTQAAGGKVINMGTVAGDHWAAGVTAVSIEPEIYVGPAPDFARKETMFITEAGGEPVPASAVIKPGSRTAISLARIDRVVKPYVGNVVVPSDLPSKIHDLFRLLGREINEDHLFRLSQEVVHRGDEAVIDFGLKTWPEIDYTHATDGFDATYDIFLKDADVAVEPLYSVIEHFRLAMIAKEETAEGYMVHEAYCRPRATKLPMPEWFKRQV